MIALLNYLAFLGALLSLLLVIPAMVGFGMEDAHKGTMLLIYAFLGLFLSLSVAMATRGGDTRLDRSGSISLAVLAWIIFPVLLALPIGGVFDVGYTDALFEAVSALTTTAADGVQNSHNAGETAIFLRATLQWVGALFTLLTFVLVLGPVRAGGMPRPRTSAGEAVGQTASGIRRSAQKFAQFYGLTTLICFALLMLTGVEAYPAMVLATTAMSAGGYTPFETDLLSTVYPSSLLVMAFFFLAAATSVFWHGMLLKMQWTELRFHRESYYVIGAAAVLMAVLFLTLTRSVNVSGDEAVFEKFAEATFNATSVVATSGLQSRPGIFALLPPLLVIALLLIGGGCYSTAGGIKFYRIGGMLFHSRTELSRLVYPHGIHQTRFGSEQYNLKLMKSIWTMFAAAMFTVLAGGQILTLTGMDFAAGMIASIAAFTNAGPAYSADWAVRGAAGWPEYWEMTSGQKMTLSAVMMLGHLEVVAIIAMLNPFYWFDNR